MAALFPIMLKAVVLDDTNNKFEMTETTTVILTIPAGTYYLRGDGTADDLLKAWEDAMNSHGGGGNTYAVTAVWSADPGAVASVRVATARTAGASTWGIRWADVDTTLDPALFGSAGANETVNAIDNNYALSPSCVWVSDEPYEEFEPIDQRDAYARRARSGKVRGGTRSATWDVRRLGLAMIDGRRTHSKMNAADPTACFDMFLEQIAGGSPFELHLTDISSGTTLTGPSAATEQGDRWHLSEDSVREFAPQRLEPGAALYDWTLELWGHV